VGAGPSALSESTAPLLQVVGLSKSFKRRDGSTLKAVDSIHLEIADNETLALVGESGSGKSTLARLILRLTPPDSGYVMYRGSAVGSLSGAALKRFRLAVQPVFQDPASSFNPRRNVRDCLRQALGQTGLARQQWDVRIDELLARVRLAPPADFLRRFPHELSGGQRQRLAIARALALDPHLIIADEPLSGADASIRGQVLNVLLDLQRERGVAYLLITHDISLARAFAARIAVMYRGTIVERGETHAVLTHPRHPYTRLLLASAPSVDGDLDLTHASSLAHRLDSPPGCVFYARCPFATDLCASKAPVLDPLEGDPHQTACHYPLE
jgi:oligopeptide/dipeptide ABC transporter ATP-binding protein